MIALLVIAQYCKWFISNCSLSDLPSVGEQIAPCINRHQSLQEGFFFNDLFLNYLSYCSPEGQSFFLSLHNKSKFHSCPAVEKHITSVLEQDFIL